MAGIVKRNCAIADCPQAQFKNGYCIDHYRQHAGLVSGQRHGHENRFGRAKLSVSEQCDEIMAKFLDDSEYDCEEKQLLEYKAKFMEMDADGSGDIGRSIEGRDIRRHEIDDHPHPHPQSLPSSEKLNYCTEKKVLLSV
jgi:hypothetical protein